MSSLGVLCSFILSSIVYFKKNKEQENQERNNYKYHFLIATV
jgi:hypothetical protein